MANYERTVVLSPGSPRRREVRLREVDVPDLWHISLMLKEKGYTRDADAILETWRLAHDFKRNLAGNI